MKSHSNPTLAEQKACRYVRGKAQRSHIGARAARGGRRAGPRCTAAQAAAPATRASAASHRATAARAAVRGVGQRCHRVWLGCGACESARCAHSWFPPCIGPSIVCARILSQRYGSQPRLCKPQKSMPHLPCWQRSAQPHLFRPGLPRRASGRRGTRLRRAPTKRAPMRLPHAPKAP